MGRRKIHSDETQYISEWAAIEGVMRDNLVYTKNVCVVGRQAFEWMLSSYDHQGRNGIVLSSSMLAIDLIEFLLRYPSIVGSIIFFSF